VSGYEELVRAGAAIVVACFAILVLKALWQVLRAGPQGIRDHRHRQDQQRHLRAALTAEMEKAK